MWVMMPQGFYSAVKDGDRICVRARVLRDLTNLRREFCPELTPATSKIGRHTDYEWRAWCSPDEWARAMARMALSINWTNFKDEVTKRQGWKRHDAYLSVWAALRRHLGRPLPPAPPLACEGLSWDDLYEADEYEEASWQR